MFLLARKFEPLYVGVAKFRRRFFGTGERVIRGGFRVGSEVVSARQIASQAKICARRAPSAYTIILFGFDGFDFRPRGVEFDGFSADFDRLVCSNSDIIFLLALEFFDRRGSGLVLADGDGFCAAHA